MTRETTYFEVSLVSGKKEKLVATSYEKRIPVYEFYVIEQRGGRPIQSVVRSYPIDDVLDINVISN